MAEGASKAAVTGDATVYLTITPEDELYARTIRTVHVMVSQQFPLQSIYSLLALQLSNGAVISFDHTASSGPEGEEQGVGVWLEAGVRVFKREQRECAKSPLMLTLFPKGIPFGFLGDGSTDRSMLEQEAVVNRYMGGDGRPFNTFHDLAELDLADSHDGRSPDASCIAMCYAKSQDELNKHEGFLYLSDWKRALVGMSFDGASVMLGSQNGAAKKIIDMTLPAEPKHVVTTHGVAHVEQLANAAAFGECEYYFEWRAILQEVYVYYAGSGKKRFGLESVANKLDAKLLKLGTQHSIRWAAAEKNTIKAFLTDLPSIAVDLEVAVKSELGFEFTLLTPSNNFLGKSFWQVFEYADRPNTRNKAKVVSFKEGSISAMDMFTLGYSKGDTLEISKGELVSKLTNEDAVELVKDGRWELRKKITVYGFVAFSAFMQDVHDELRILSESFQSNALVVFDISKNVNRSLKALNKLKVAAGKEEKLFLDQVEKEEGADMYLSTCQLFEGAEGRSAMKVYRMRIVESLEKHLTERFQKVLDDPILNAMSMFDHRKWYMMKDCLVAAYKDEVEILYNRYSHFFEPDETLEAVRDQWEEMAAEIISAEGLMSLKYHDLWARMLVQYSDEYSLILRLVVISLIVPADTSECERIFSLTNDIKTSERSRMGQRNLKNLMLWHRMASALKPQDIPVMAILKEFRDMATGPKGRSAHRPQNPISYEYEKNRAAGSAHTNYAS